MQEITGSITTLPGAIDGWEIAPQVDITPETDITVDDLPQAILDLESPDSFYIIDPSGFPGWKRHREAVSGCVVTVDGDDPVLLAENIEHGCTVVYFAKSSAGGMSGQIDVAIAGSNIEISMYECRWEMRIEQGNLTIFRTAGKDTLEISVMVVKL